MSQGSSLKILHVSEAYGGGVEWCVKNWTMRSFPDSTLIVGRDRKFRAEQSGYLNEVISKNLLFFFFDYFRAVKKFNPDVIHLHSSIAGILRIFKTRRKYIYSPHCFAFERTDVSKLSRWFFWKVEQILSHRTAAFVCVSGREIRLSRELNPEKRSILLEHRYSVDKAAFTKITNTVVAIGRICNQKNPAFFAEIARCAINSELDLNFVWIGAGDEVSTAQLKESGVDVLGWLEEKEILTHLSTSLALLHTADWEGGPVVFAQSQSMSVPIVCVNKNYSELTNMLLFRTSSEAVAILQELKKDSEGKNRTINLSPGFQLELDLISAYQMSART
jgi:glycosyltransferase involved in cell wall biosynthesis